MKLHLQQELYNRGTDPPVSYKPDITVDKKTESKSDALKVDINTHPGKVGIEKISIYVPVFKKG